MITATNVVAHVDNLNAFIAATVEALAPRGQFILECPYVLEFIEHNEFDTAYHEHLSYMGVTPLVRLVSQHGLEVVNVRYFDKIHGGTIRVHAARQGDYAVSPTVQTYLDREARFGIRTETPYRNSHRESLTCAIGLTGFWLTCAQKERKSGRMERVRRGILWRILLDSRRS